MEIIDKFSRTLGLTDSGEDSPPAKDPPPPEPKEPPVQPPPTPNQTGHNVIDFNSVARDNLMTNNNSTNTKGMERSKIARIEPKSFDDANVISDCLRANIPVIINLEQTAPEHARRIIDFAMGTTYAIEGDVQQVSERVFICTPKTVMVTFNREEIKSSERDFSWLTRKI